MKRRGVTTRPAVLPLLPLGLVGMYVGARVLDVATGLAFAVGLPLDEIEVYGAGDVRSAGLALGIATDVVLLVLASILLRWLTRRWVRRQGPDPRVDELCARRAAPSTAES